MTWPHTKIISLEDVLSEFLEGQKLIFEDSKEPEVALPETAEEGPEEGWEQYDGNDPLTKIVVKDGELQYWRKK